MPIAVLSVSDDCSRFCGSKQLWQNKLFLYLAIFFGGKTGEESLVLVLFTCNKQMRELVGFFKNLISCVLVYNGKAISWILIMSAGQT